MRSLKSSRNASQSTLYASTRVSPDASCGRQCAEMSSGRSAKTFLSLSVGLRIPWSVEPSSLQRGMGALMIDQMVVSGVLLCCGPRVSSFSFSVRSIPELMVSARATIFSSTLNSSKGRWCLADSAWSRISSHAMPQRRSFKKVWYWLIKSAVHHTWVKYGCW